MVRDGWLQAKTEGLVISAQDGVILTNRYKHTVLKKSTTSTCRVCQEEDETISQIMSSYKSHLWSLYKERHDRVVYQLMAALAAKLDVRVPNFIKLGASVWHGMAILDRTRAQNLS